MADFQELLRPRGTAWEDFQKPTSYQYLRNGFGYLAYSFESAAEELMGRWRERRSDVLEFPLAFLCRHQIELELKALWIACADVGFSGGAPEGVHHLPELWSPVREFCESVGLIHPGDAFVQGFDQFLTYLDGIDRHSTTFRYPTRKTFKVEFAVDVEALWRSMEACQILFFGLNEMISQYRDHLDDKH